VATSKIADSAIITVKLADGSVTSAKILDGTITAADLASDLLTTIHIADGAVITSKIADYAVTDMKLAAGAIPFAAVHNSTRVSTTSPTWVNMPATSVNLTLTRASNVIITFSTEAWLGSASGYLNVRAMVNTTQAYPTNGTTTITRDNTVAASYSFTFYCTELPPGTYTVAMQWQTPTGTQANVEDRTLTVIALPA
jgi:molybdopterin-binding protein